MPRLAPALFLAALFLAAPARSESAADPSTSVPLAPAVTVAAAVEREIVERTVVTGTLVPRDEILVAPEVEGLRITELMVEEGDHVDRGQVLARLSYEMIETQEAANEAAVARAKAAIVQARSQIQQAEALEVEARQALDRARSLIATGNATAVTLEQRVAASLGAQGRVSAARGGLELAEAELATARAQGREIALRRARTEIRAPEAGIVHRRTARVGATASAVGEPLFRLIARGEIELEGDVPETALARLAAGAPAQLDMEEGRILQGRVRRVYPEVDRATRLGKVRVSLMRDPTLHVGAFARGQVVVARRQGIVVPLSAVLYAGDGTKSVLTVAEGIVEARTVVTGLSAEGSTELRSGVAAGETVVVRAGSFLRAGDRVRPVLPQAEAVAR